MIRVGVSLENPLDAEILATYMIKQPLCRGGRRASGCGVVVEDGVDDRSDSAIGIRHHVAERPGRRIEKRFYRRDTRADS